MIEINEVLNHDRKAVIYNDILRSLPKWFGIESSIVDYTEQSKSMLFFESIIDGKSVGFITLKKHNDFTAEIHVMGILDKYHRMGIGKKLISYCEEFCRKIKIEFLTVKTLSEKREDENYVKTRLFYEAMGFKPLEVFPLLWDESNPCLFMAKYIKNA